MSAELKGRIDITREEATALEAGYLLKKVVMGKSPKKGDHFAACFSEPGCQQFIRCVVYLKEQISPAVPKPYRLIFGRWPG